jgi:alpha-1,3-rhamnosyl/mannosyltransferase
LARWANVLALRTARVALAISEATRRDYLAHFRVPAERIVTAPLAADPVFRPQSDAAIAALRERLALPERYVLYLGSNKPHKNLVGLIEAWQIANQQISKSANQRMGESTNGRINEWAELGSRLTFDVSRFTLHVSRFTFHAPRLVIAGAWDDRYPEAKQRVAALGLGDSVTFLGPVAGTDLPALYAGAELFVFPSLYEGFGFPVLEAMACGTPVICSNVSSLPEVAGSAARQVDPRDTNALAAALDQVLGDAALRQRMRHDGLAQAGRFSWTRTALQTLDAYRRVMNEANESR